MSEFEKKFGKYALNNLPLIMIMCYGVGYIIEFINYDFLRFLTMDPYKILHGQVWRLITWIIVPPSQMNIIFIVLTLFIYYSISRNLERMWGTYQYNVYILSGIFITTISVLIFWVLYGLIVAISIDNSFLSVINSSNMMLLSQSMSYSVSTYYLNMSVFLAFLASFPEARILLYFIIPVKAKWMSILYAAFLVYDFIVAPNIIVRIVIVASVLNFGAFLLRTKTLKLKSPVRMKQQQDFNRDYSRTSKMVTRHKCAICGRTEQDSPDMQFRFCSKCEGNYEYCEQHLYTHTHVHAYNNYEG